MSEQRHTPEPWHWFRNSHYIEIGTGECQFSGDQIGDVCASKWVWGEEVAEANARRIVACVNACAGIPTDDLESSAADMQTLEAARANSRAWISQLRKAERQRDQLREALAAVIDPATNEDGEWFQESRWKARAAIAAAEATP